MRLKLGLRMTTLAQRNLSLSCTKQNEPNLWAFLRRDIREPNNIPFIWSHILRNIHQELELT